MPNNPIGTSAAEWQEAASLVKLWDEMGKEKIERLVAQLVPSDAQVVDVGCGNGRYARHFANYRGYDQSRAMLNHAPDSCTYANIFDGAPYDDMPDVCLSIDTSRHYADPIGLLRTIMERWPAKQYLFSVLCGPRTEERSNIMVLSREDAAAGIASLGNVVEEFVEYLGELEVRYILVEARNHATAKRIKH